MSSWLQSLSTSPQYKHNNLQSFQIIHFKPFSKFRINFSPWSLTNLSAQPLYKCWKSVYARLGITYPHHENVSVVNITNNFKYSLYSTDCHFPQTKTQIKISGVRYWCRIFTQQWSCIVQSKPIQKGMSS